MAFLATVLDRAGQNSSEAPHYGVTSDLMKQWNLKARTRTKVLFKTYPGMNQHILEAVGGGILPGPLLTHLAMELVYRLL